jgi:hypothetical protein
VQELETGPLHRFQDWPNEQVPRRAAGVYTVWDGDRLLYVGMSGRAMTAEDLEASHSGRVVATGLWTGSMRMRLVAALGISSACMSATASWSQLSRHPSSTSSPPAGCRSTVSPETSSASGSRTDSSSWPMESRRPGWRAMFDEGCSWLGGRI